MVVTLQISEAKFPIRSENDLEEYLVARPSLTGQDLLVIGRQVMTIGGIIDVLAIDSAGTIYIFELKLNDALPSILSQGLRYRRSVRQLTRDALVQIVAGGRLKIDLVEAFQQRFGCPLPNTVNATQVLVIIAASIHSHTAESILELLDLSCSVSTYRYVVRRDSIELIPCCRSNQDVEEDSHLATRQVSPPASLKSKRMRSGNYPTDHNIRRFWLTSAQDFTPFVTFSYIFERYKSWIQHQTTPASISNRGLFGRHLSAITAESDEWSRVFVAHRKDMSAYETLMVPPSTRTYRGDHTVVAYQRTLVIRAPRL